FPFMHDTTLTSRLLRSCQAWWAHGQPPSARDSRVRGGAGGGATSTWPRAGPWEPPRGLRRCVPLQLAHEGDQGGLLPRRQLYAQDEVEELHRILQREQPPIVQVRRRILDTPQGEGLDRPLGMNPLTIDGAGRIEAFHFQIVHLVGEIDGRRV